MAKRQAPKLSNSLNEKLFLDKLQSSGLDFKDADRLGFKFLASATEVLPHVEKRPALLLPYFDFTGKVTPFFRVRLLGQSRSFAAGSSKELRYAQPRDTGVQAYFPRTVDWPSVVSDTTQPLYLTEGELKAACACKHGLPTVGLGGVYSWRSAKRGLSFLPELEEIAWAGRHVFVVFDSDAQTNHQVMQALRHLCAELTQRGALPFVTRLPDLPGMKKVGLDDFLVLRGVDELADVFERAEQYGLAEELWKLNDKVCFVRDPGFVFELDSGARMSVMSFTREVYANLFYTEREETPKGSRVVKVPTAQAWVKWGHRLETRRVTYRPGEPRFVDGELNTWRGTGLQPVAGDVTPWRVLVDHLFEDDPEARRWFERWCAYPLARPGTKMLTAVVLWGVHQGTGKSLLGYSLARLYGEWNTSEINQEHLRSNYNDWLVDKQLVLGEEITGSDRRADADRLKTLITQKSIRVSSKYVREYTVPAMSNFFFTSNHPDAFFLEDTDRRFFVHEVRRPPLPSRFYQDYAVWLRSEAGAQALLHHLSTLDLGDFDPAGPALETRSKREMIEDNKSDLAAWVLRLKREPREVLREAGLPEEACVLSTSQLLAAYDPQGTKRVTLNGLGRELKRSLVPRRETIGVATSRGMTTFRFYVLQDVARLEKAAPRVLAEHWSSLFGRLPDPQKKIK